MVIIVTNDIDYIINFLVELDYKFLFFVYRKINKFRLFSLKIINICIDDIDFLIFRY